MDCEDEPFDFFDEAKAFALGKLSAKPEIHQTEVVRNDFGECVDSTDYGKVWSWDEVMSDIPEDTDTVFSKSETFGDIDTEFDNVDNSLNSEERIAVPDDMTIDGLVEANLTNVSLEETGTVEMQLEIKNNERVVKTFIVYIYKPRYYWKCFRKYR